MNTGNEKCCCDPVDEMNRIQMLQNELNNLRSKKNPCELEPVIQKELALWEIFEITERQINELYDVVNAIESKLAGPYPVGACGKEPACGLIDHAKRNSENLSPIISKLYRIAERL